MYLRMLDGRPMSLLARAEFIGEKFAEVDSARAAVDLPPLAPIPPIDYDGDRLSRVRRESRSVLREQLGREPAADEVAIEVAREYRDDEPAPRAALRKMRRLVREAERYEFVFPGHRDVTGRESLPSPRD